jgi:hypothetical protein
VQQAVVQWDRQQTKEFFAIMTCELGHQWDFCPVLLPMVISFGNVVVTSSVSVLEQLSVVHAPFKQNKIQYSPHIHG